MGFLVELKKAWNKIASNIKNMCNKYRKRLL